MKKIENIEDLNNILNLKKSENDIEEKKQTECKGFTITEEIMAIDNLKTKVLKYVLYKKRTEQDKLEQYIKIANLLSIMENLDIGINFIEKNKQGYDFILIITLILLII